MAVREQALALLTFGASILVPIRGGGVFDAPFQARADTVDETEEGASRSVAGLNSGERDGIRFVEVPCVGLERVHSHRAARGSHC